MIAVDHWRRLVSTGPGKANLLPKTRHTLDTIMPRKSISASLKNAIAARQSHKCKRVDGYTCPLGDRTFDEAGFHIDHIIELGDGGTDEETNLQALCPSCHAFKTSKNARKRVPKPPVPRTVVPVQTFQSRLGSWSSEQRQDAYLTELLGKPTSLRFMLQKHGIPFTESSFTSSNSFEGNHGFCKSLVFDFHALMNVFPKRFAFE